MEQVVIKDTASGKMLIVDDISEWTDEISSGQFEYLWTMPTDTVQELTFQLAFNYIDMDSCRWQTQIVAFSKSVETLMAKAVERKDIYDQQWQYDNGAFELKVNDEETFTITPITLI